MSAKLLRWSEDQEEDKNKPHIHRSGHVRSVILNDRFYLFHNLTPDNKSPIKIVDPSIRMMFDLNIYGLAAENRPSCSRINYSIAAERHKIFLYGGFDVEKNEIVDTVETFDASTYQFREVKHRGDFKPLGR
jgi:hypothetical protein